MELFTSRIIINQSSESADLIVSFILIFFKKSFANTSKRILHQNRELKWGKIFFQKNRKQVKLKSKYKSSTASYAKATLKFKMSVHSSVTN